MRKIWSKWIVAVAVVAFSSMATGTAKAQGSVSLQVFYDELQPYGTWVDHGRYGYVWMPNEGSDFVPYGSNGYWVQTGYGNTWVSNYSWGWAPFHYGRWFYDDFYGWLWVPDTTWGPAWVTWRSGGGYYGWAPLMPGLSISLNVGYYNHIPSHYWNFVPYRYVMYRQVYRHCVPRPRVVNVINHTTVIVNNNYYGHEGSSQGRDRSDGRDRADYFTGPSRSDIEQRNGERVPVYDVHDRNRPGQTEVSRSSVSLYKPAIERSTRTQALPAEFTRDNAQGRENISELRSRQLRGQRSGESFDDNRDAIRRSEGSVPGNPSSVERLRQRETSNDARRDLEDLRRDVRPDRGSTEATEPSNNRSDVLDRTNRDAGFNRVQGQKEAELLRRQQNDVKQRQQAPQEDQLQRFKEQRQQESRQQDQRFQQQRQLEDLQRQHEAPRQAPSRQPAQSQQRTSPSRQQQFAPTQQRSSQPRMSAPQKRGSTSQPQQRSGNSRSSGSQRSKE
ncbi:MAG TPA: DUF6600 domain-containing protein [Chryseolinea sp.]|nr:DUF6600 domain-containing protein [Chryseolinea sp.]